MENENVDEETYEPQLTKLKNEEEETYEPQFTKLKSVDEETYEPQFTKMKNVDEETYAPPFIKLKNLDEETYEPPTPLIQRKESIYLCKCLMPGDSSEKVVISERKQKVLSTVARTESYLRERRIPELIRFLLTKVIAHASCKPILYLENLLNDCMLFRAGYGTPPVLYEHQHLEAVVKSFDPGERGWLSAGQLRRAFTTLGISPNITDLESISVEVAIAQLKEAQENDLLNLLNAGMVTEEPIE